jgi:hypothetical protein
MSACAKSQQAQSATKARFAPRTGPNEENRPEVDR